VREGDRGKVLSFFLSWVSKTQPNHWTKRMANTRFFFLSFFLSSSRAGFDFFESALQNSLLVRSFFISIVSHTLAKLQAKNLQGSVDFHKTFWPSAADMDSLRQEDDWRHVAEEHFSVDNIRKYDARSPPFSAQDADGWRSREHVPFLFSEKDEEFHNLIRKHMVMPFVIGDFFPGHSEEVAGGKYFASVKPNADGAPIPNAGGAPVDANMWGIVIGST